MSLVAFVGSLVLVGLAIACGLAERGGRAAAWDRAGGPRPDRSDAPG